MLFRTLVLPAIVATSLLSMNANAALDANQTFQQFNAVVLGNIDSTSHLHGRTWVGGDVNGGEYVFRDLPTSDYAGLTVIGNASNGRVLAGGAVVQGNLSNLGVNNGGAAVLGNANNAHFNGAGSYVKGTATDITFNGGKLPTPDSNLQTKLNAANSTNFYNVLSNTSYNLSQLDNTSSVSFNGGKATFTATADNNGLAVFNLTADEASKLFTAIIVNGALRPPVIGEFDFVLNGATTVVINTDLKDIDTSANFLGGSAQKIAGNVIWNFYNAESIDFGAQFGGSVLAVNATLTNKADIEGNVYVNNLVQNGQIHQYAFTGSLPVAAVPEPSSYAMFLIGLGLLAFGARRRA